MARELVIALDIGTTSAKAVIFELNGKLVAEAERMITSYYPHVGWVEQDPVEIEQAAVGAMKDVIAKANSKQDELLTLGISCAMHALICVDEHYQPLSQAIIWADGRSNEQAQELKKTVGNEIYAKTGLPNHPMSPLSKLLWMKETAFEPYQQASYFMSTKEYIIQKWFGRRLIDYSMASATGLFNMTTFDWDEQALALAGVDKKQLSDIVPPTEILMGIDKGIAAEMGISSNMPVVIGSADGQLSNLGSGAISPGEVAISAGTSGAIRQMITGFDVSEHQETFCYAFTRDLSIIGGPTNNGGIALQWLKELIEYGGSFDELTAEAEQVAPGAEGLLFLPYINGERAPLWNQEAKGNFFGLSITHKKEHLVRAVLEGITYNLYHIGKALERQAGEPDKLFVNGGLARSPLWVQMLADVFGKEVYLSESHHSAAWGAAWTALVAVGKVDSFEDIKHNIPIEAIIKPNQQNHDIYRKAFEKYEMIAKDLAKYF
ncbi:gluconokinase [Sporosarcina sp. YIM B06819]|uniref:gluconokinase n=1 Tax=Sporosarcina sp. YIM B06819 TaxID=3081769 RepID=UPI00298BE3ED|nr:gluconokinase [Sporosarcina sp. YIM B06819]